MDFHDKMCILVESEDEARQLCEILTEAKIPWIAGVPCNMLVTFKSPAVYYCLTGVYDLRVWWHETQGRHQQEVEQDVAEGRLEPPVRFCDLANTKIEIPTMDDLL